jgi:hypothetical protein
METVITHLWTQKRSIAPSSYLPTENNIRLWVKNPNKSKHAMQCIKTCENQTISGHVQTIKAQV